MKDDKDKDRGGGGGPKKLMVQITSLDGHEKHPFDKTDTVSGVHRFAYERLVRQKDQYPIGQTWLEHNSQRVDGSTILSALAERQQGGGPEADLILALSWNTEGG